MKYALATLLGFLLIVGAVLSIYRTHQGALPSAAQASSTASTFVVTETAYDPPSRDAAPAGTHTYINSEHGFSLQYPEDLKVTERKEGPDADSVTYENADGSKGFQIFIVEYKDSQITKSRIDLDTKKGAEGKPVEVVLPATHALMFFSNDSVFGRLREVWFLHGGHLYEVTTYAELDTWLASIMHTWTWL